MIALLGGLGAAVCFMVSALCASAASRAIGAASTVAWVMLIGLAYIAVPTAVLAPASQLSPSNVGWLVTIGVTNAVGLRIMYVALRRGKVGVVSAIVSTEGVLTAVISIAAGASLSLATGALLLVVSAGVALAAARPDPESHHPGGIDAGLLALTAAVLFAVNLYATGRVGHHVSLLWVLVPARLFGTVTIALPLALRGKLVLTRRTLPLVAAAGLAEVVGIASYTVGARHGLAVAAVIASQYAALTAVGAFFVFRERLTRLQLGGLIVIAVGVGVLAAVRA